MNTSDSLIIYLNDTETYFMQHINVIIHVIYLVIYSLMNTVLGT